MTFLQLYYENLTEDKLNTLYITEANFTQVRDALSGVLNGRNVVFPLEPLRERIFDILALIKESAVGFKSGFIELRDRRAKVPLIECWRAHESDICTLALSPSGSRLASSSSDSLVHIWNLAKISKKNPEPIVSFKEHRGTVKGLAWYPSGEFIATGGGSKDGKIHIWNSNTTTILGSINTGKPVSALSWPTSTSLLSASAKNNQPNGLMTYSVDLQKKKIATEVQLPDAHDRRIISMVLSPNKSTAVTLGGDDLIQFWKLNSFKKPKAPKKVSESLFSKSTIR